MNLGEYTSRIFARADWAPTQSATAKARVHGFINDAIERLVRDAPFAFFEREWSFATQPDHLPAGPTDTITPWKSAFGTSLTGNDPWVVIRDTLVSTLDAADRWPVDDAKGVEAAQQHTDPSTYGSNARRFLAIRYDNNWYRFRIRRIFQRDPWIADSGGDFQMISLFDPIPEHLRSSIGPTADWHIYTAEYVLPPTCVRVNSMWLHRSSETWPLQALTQKQAEKLSLKDIPDQVSKGRPRSYFKWGRFEMPTPTKAMQFDRFEFNWQDDGISFSDMCEPPGTFQYRYTYCWGTRDTEFVQPGSANANMNIGSYVGDTGLTFNHPIPVPLFESAPSPATGEIEVMTTADTASQALRPHFDIPNIEAIQGFDVDTTIRQFQSGWWIRVYRRRLTTVKQDAKTYHNEFPEETDEYFFYSDISAPSQESNSPGSWPVQFQDYGGSVPDYNVRLQETNGNFQFGLYPRPDRRYVINVRLLERPQNLADEQDTPPVHPEADDAVIDLALHLLAEAEGHFDHAQLAYQRYKMEHLPALRSVYGPDTAEDTVHYRKPARARNARRGQRRWWDTNSS